MLYQLGEEEKVIKQLERQYRKALEDVEMVIRILMTDEQTPSKINRINYQKRLQTQLEGVLEALHTNQYKTINAFLQDSYTDSFVGAVYDMHGQHVPLILPVDQNAAVKAIQLDTKLSERKIHPNLNGEHVTLYESLGVDIDHLKKAIRQEITRGIATGMEIKDIARNISLRTKAPLSRAKTIARTESHRIQESSKQDARTAAREKGADVVKKWDSTMDGDTRPDHRALDGQIREVDEPFEIHGKRAMNPGGFGKPGDDCNCRCLGLTIARWLLGEEDLERMQEKAKYWDLDKTQDFADFKKKYLKAAEEESKSSFKPATTREEAYKLLTDYVGFYEVSKSLQHIDDDIIIAQANQLARLNEKFGAIKPGHTGYIGAENSTKFIAVTRGNFRHPDAQNLVLSFDAYGRGHDALVRMEGKYITSGYNMPALDKYIDVYSTTHEYGHILGHGIVHDMVDFDEFDKKERSAGTDLKKRSKVVHDESKKHYKSIWSEIVAIAKERNPAFKVADHISDYGKTSYEEAFAETFANSQLGKPNELGDAMNIWLSRNGHEKPAKTAKPLKNQGKSGIIKTDKQFGKKIGKHAVDYGLDPSKPEDREKMRVIIDDISENPDEIAHGNWAGQSEPVKFYIKNGDVVVATESGAFITILKGGITNARVKNARRE